MGKNKQDMNKCSCEYIVEKLRIAVQARDGGMNCPQALLETYREELGENYLSAAELAGQLPELLGEPELCDVFAAAFAIIARLTGISDGYRPAADRLRKEYGGSRCGSGGEDSPLCTQRMKDCVLMIQWVVGQASK